jgi:hypothetical protein
MSSDPLGVGRRWAILTTSRKLYTRKEASWQMPLTCTEQEERCTCSCRWDRIPSWGVPIGFRSAIGSHSKRLAVWKAYLSVGVTGVLDTDVLDARGAGSGDGGSVTEVAAKAHGKKFSKKKRTTYSALDSRVDTGQDLSVVGLNVLEDNVTSGGLGADRLLLAVSTASVELAEVLRVDDIGSAGHSQRTEKRETRKNLR